MKTKIETAGRPSDLTYPCLVASSGGAVILYVTSCQGTVLHTTADSKWTVGDEVRSDIKLMLPFSRTLRLWN